MVSSARLLVDVGEIKQSIRLPIGVRRRRTPAPRSPASRRRPAAAADDESEHGRSLPDQAQPSRIRARVRPRRHSTSPSCHRRCAGKARRNCSSPSSSFLAHRIDAPEVATCPSSASARTGIGALRDPRPREILQVTRHAIATGSIPLAFAHVFGAFHQLRHFTGQTAIAPSHSRTAPCAANFRRGRSRSRCGGADPPCRRAPRVMTAHSRTQIFTPSPCRICGETGRRPIIDQRYITGIDSGSAALSATRAGENGIDRELGDTRAVPVEPTVHHGTISPSRHGHELASSSCRRCAQADINRMRITSSNWNYVDSPRDSMSSSARN